MSSDSIKKMMKSYILQSTGLFPGLILYDDILDLLSKNTIITKSGSPQSWDQTSFTKTNLWNGKTLLHIGSTNSPGNIYPNGLKITIDPMITNTLSTANNLGVYSYIIWIRALNDRSSVFKLYDSTGSLCCVSGFGFRGSLSIYNDFAPQSVSTNFHLWFPITVSTAGKFQPYYTLVTDSISADGWLSGIGFSNNPFNYAVSSWLVLQKQLYLVKSTNSSIVTDPTNLNNMINTAQSTISGEAGLYLQPNFIHTFMIPVIPSNCDKVLFISSCDFTTPAGIYLGRNPSPIITANSIAITKLANYYNPFSVAINSKQSYKYLGSIIPSGLINNGDKFVKITIDLTGLPYGIYFREIGTHDYN